MTIMAWAETALLLPVALVPVALLLRSESLRQRLVWIAVAGGAAVLVLAPWTVYNLSRSTARCSCHTTTA